MKLGDVCIHLFRWSANKGLTLWHCLKTSGALEEMGTIQAWMSSTHQIFIWIHVQPRLV